MAVTRIKNNQITDATITAAKIASQTLVGSLFATDLTLNSNLSVIGNLTVTGTSSNINAINTYITDPFVIFNNGYTGSLTNYTIGMLVNRNLASLNSFGAVNTAWVWSEAEEAFTGIATTDTGTGVVSINNTGYANIKIGNLNAVTSITTSRLTATTVNYTDEAVTTLVATNFSTGNAVISSGYISSLANATITTGNAQSWYSTNLNSTNGNITTLTALVVNAGTTTSATLNATTGNITNLDASTTTSAVLNATTGNITNLDASTTTSATLNATTGNITTLGVGTATSATLNATTGNITTLGVGTATSATLNATNGNITTLNTGTSTSAVLNATNGNITTLNTGTSTSATLNATTGNITNGSVTTLVATNFSSGNAVITGGSLNNTPIGANTPESGTFTTATATTLNATTVNAGTTTSATLNATTGNITNLGASTTTSTTLNATSGNVTTLVATNFSTGNAVITGGALNDTPIGAATKSTGAFTTLTSNGLTTFTNATQSDNASTGAIVVTGGAGIGANLNVGGNLTVSGNLTILGTTTTVNSQTLDVADLNITVAKGAASAAAANGAGLTVDAANATILYASADDSWNLNKKLNATTVNAALVNVTTANITTATFTDESATTLVATNFSSGNAVITGGSLNNTPIGASTPTTGTFTTATATTLNATTVNAGTTTSATLNATDGNITTLGAGATTSATLNASNGNITTLSAGTTTSATLNATTGNITTLDASITTSAVLNATTGNITTLGVVTATAVSLNVTTGNITSGRATTFVADNFSSPNTVVAGGSINNTVIGTTTPADATFTTLKATGNIVAGAGTNATNYTTGALVVPNGGGVGITGDLWVQGFSTFSGNITAGNIQLSGNINVPVGGTFSNTGVFYGNAGGVGALYAGTTAYVPLPTTVFQMTGNVNTYAQTNFQNINTGSSATTDFVITADDGNDSIFYGDFGILGSAYNGALPDSFLNGLGTAGFPNDTYLYSHGNPLTPGVGGNLLIGTAVPGSVIRAFAGGMNIADVVTTTTSSGFQVNAATQSTSTTTGALRVAGGTGIVGNINVGSGAAFNTSQTANYDFVVKGVNDGTLIWARPGSSYDSVVVGGSGTTSTLITGAKLIVNTTDSILIPVGTTAQRPGSAGGTDTAGMIRFNTSNAQLEFYNGSSWTNTGTSFTVVASDIFDGDDITTTFNLGAAATTQSVIVSINGIVQIPTLAYSVSGTTLTFTQAPATGDKIEVRRLSTTATVSTFESGNGYVSFVATNSFANINAGTGSATNRMSFNTTGNVSVTANVAPSANVAYDLGNINSWWKNTFTNKIITGGADLAENYVADAVYGPGTVVEFGGPAEITVSLTEGSTRVAGVITTDPGHVMNGGLKGSTVASVALVGRVPCNVIGPVYKGDMLVSAGYGYARACTTPTIGSVIGKAVANFEGEKGTVEVVVGRL